MPEPSITSISVSADGVSVKLLIEDDVFFFYRSDDARHEFGERRAYGDYSKPDELFAHSRGFGKRGGAVHHEVAAEYYSRKPQGRQNYIQPKRLLLFFAFFGRSAVIIFCVRHGFRFAGADYKKRRVTRKQREEGYRLENIKGERRYYESKEQQDAVNAYHYGHVEPFYILAYGKGEYERADAED